MRDRDAIDIKIQLNPLEDSCYRSQVNGNECFCSSKTCQLTLSLIPEVQRNNNIACEHHPPPGVEAGGARQHRAVQLHRQRDSRSKYYLVQGREAAQVARQGK